MSCVPTRADAMRAGHVSEDAVLGGRLRLRQFKQGHRVGHDAILLAAATTARSGDRAVEFGAGVGAAGLALAVRCPDVDVTLVEGAVSSEEDVHRAEIIRANSKIVVSLGDCAITANVPGMRNPWTIKEVLERVYVENATLHRQVPDSVVPKLLPYVRPLHEFIKVDAYIPGCPPSADAIHYAICELIEGRVPELAMRTHFGA